MIDLKARELLRQRAMQREMMASISKGSNANTEAVGKSISEPMTGLMGKAKDQLSLSVFSLATLQKILRKLSTSEVLNASVKDIRTEVEIPEFPSEVTLNSAQQREIVDNLKKIKIPTPPDKVSVTNFKEVTESLDKVQTYLKSLVTSSGKSKVEGKVEVINFPETKVDLQPVISAIESLKTELKAVQTVQKQAIPIGRIEKPVDNTPRLLEALAEIKNGIEKLYKKPTESAQVEVTNFPVQHIPTPVTHISINALNGTVKSTAVTVTGMATKLPATILSNRRSLIVYNSDTLKTLYIGGSTVAASGTGQGLPVPPQSYAPALDASQNMVVYGIVSSGSITVNCMEISDLDTGT